MRHRKSHTLLPLASALGAAFACGGAHAQQAVLPAAPTVVSGQVNVSSPGAQQLVVNQQSGRAVVNWDSFSVSAGAQVNFLQPGSTSAILNRVTGSASSSIAGQINANGQVFLVNPNGIEITPTGTVRAAGATLSTLDIADADFLGGRLSFAGGGASATVTNRGTITGTSGGFAALLGGQVSNDGRIEVPFGRIGVGSGERATLDLLGSRFLQVAVPTARNTDGRALVEVAGTISADGGRIEVSTATAREALRQAVNIPGGLVARSVAGRSGDIVLSAGGGGSATVSGTLDVSAADTTGGSVTVTGDSITLQRARIDASGAAGGGSVQLGGGAMGQGPLPHARQLQMDDDSVVNADATRDGNGGRIVLWSDARTGFRGTLSARGAGSGAGGFAEVSSGMALEYAGRTDLRADRGATGTLLLDPYDVTISSGADTGPCCTATADNTVINTTTLQNALATANVTVSTGAGGAQNGDITVADPVSWGSGNTLTLSAARDITVNAAISGTGGLQLDAGRDIAINSNITAVGGPLNVGLAASATAGRILVNSAAIDTGGGNLTASATQTGPGNALRLSDATLNVGNGTGTVTVGANGNATFASGNLALLASGAGSITISSTGNAGSGLFFNISTAITTAGTVSVSGASTANSGLYFLGSNTIDAGSGSLALSGSSASFTGVWFNGGTNTLATSGALSINGTSTGYRGMGFNGGVTVATTGNIGLAGTSTSGEGLWFNSTNTISAANGTLALTGNSGSADGVFVNFGANSFTHSGTGSITLSGNSGTASGLLFNTAVTLATSGSVALNGTSGSGLGVALLGGNALTAGSGSLAVTGGSGSLWGVYFSGSDSLTNAGATSFTVAGASGSGIGLFLRTGAALTTAGDVALTGSGSTTGISLASGATVANAGSGTLHLDAVAGGIDLGSTFTSPAGTLWLTAAGNVTQSSGSIDASNLLLAGAGNYTLEAAGNQLQTLAANAGAVTLRSATDLTIGSVLGTPGATTSGAITLRSDGNLTIAAGAPVSGASPVLVAGGEFINNAGAGALTTTSGRWLVYAADPATSTFGGLDSGNTALWNASYALTPPASVGAAGDRYLFALQPTLGFAAVDATKVYGDDATGAIQSSFAVTGFHPGVASAFLADTAATAYSGAALLASPGADPTADVAGSPYALSLSAGTVSSPAGYALAFSAGSVNLTVTPRPITVSATPQSRLYGEPNPPLTYQLSAGDLVNGDTLSGSLDTTALAGSPAGAYGIGQGTLSAGANYALAYVPASLNVRLRPTPVDGDVARHIYTQPGPALGYDTTGGEQPLADVWNPTSVTPADAARYIVLLVDDVPHSVPHQTASGLAGFGQPSRHLQADSVSQVMAALEREHHLERMATWPIPPMEIVCVLYRLPQGSKREDLVDSLRRHRHVRAVEPLQEFTPLAQPEASPYNDPYVDLQRGFAEIGAARAHRLSVGRNTTVAVVDTAVDLGHPDLRGRIAGSRDMVESGAPAQPQQARHGTEVAGIIAASGNNGQGIVGIAPAADLSVYRACWYPAAGAMARCNTFTLAKALGGVLQSGARIVNLSLGGPADSVLEILLRRLIAEGRIVVAALPASGRPEGFPAGVPGALVVGSIDKDPPPTNVLAAPGRDLLTLVPGGRYDFGSGSSLAAAHVSGAAALLLSMDPTLSADAVRKLLSDSAATPARMINAEAAAMLLHLRRQYSVTHPH